MGIVYRARDNERGMEVALKTLRRVDPPAIYRLKQEFRALAETAHENLVSLYELVCAAELWFFTMEFVEGVDFLTYVSGGHAASVESTQLTGATRETLARESTITLNSSTGADLRGESPGPHWPLGAQGSPLNLGRLRSCVRQLVAGIDALHDSGHLHGDGKPSNGMVTDGGRLVLLDFGVIRSLGAVPTNSDRLGFAGTPAYMAPESGREEVAVAASDWYSVGVMLYEALAGCKPFAGSPSQVLRLKQNRIPPSPRRFRPDVPDDLDELCIALLQPDPRDRPTGRELRALIRASDVYRADGDASTAVPLDVTSATGDSASDEEVLIGREAELERLRDALDAVEIGRGRIVYVHGHSGMGKTSLVTTFLREVEDDSRAVVLSGRCYECESVPYKAADSLVDTLSTYLAMLPDRVAEALTPRDVHALARMFPVLRRVPAVARRSDAEEPFSDSRESRRRAFAALRLLVSAIAERVPVVLFVDDLQWGDADSAPLLDALMRPPDPPRALFIACYRTEEASRSAILKALFRRDSRLGPASISQEIEVGALSLDAARRLADSPIRRRCPDPTTAAVIVRESNGNPYFIRELARWAALDDGRNGETGLAPSIERAILARVERLPADAKKLLEHVALAGKPMRQRDVEVAVELHGAASMRLFKQLRAERLLTLSGVREDDLVEPYHDRIRQAIAASLSPEVQRARHSRLAYALEVSGEDNAESLVSHYLAAGQPDRAASHVLAAAEQSSRALAFERAAELYSVALGLPTFSNEERSRTLKVKLGGALIDAGRNAEGAAMLVEAAAGADTSAVFELRRRAAFEYLRAGCLDEGMAQLDVVLRVARCRIPTTSRRALLPFLARRAWLRLRGLRFVRKDPTEVSPLELARLDAYWAAAAGLLMCDPIRAADFHTRHLLLALRVGDMPRVKRALTLEFVLVATMVRGNRHRAEKVRRSALEVLVGEDESSELVAWFEAGSALLEYQTGRLRHALRHAERAVELSKKQSTLRAWEVASAELYVAWSLYYLGAIDRLSTRVHAQIEDAQQRGDLYASSNARLGLCNSVWLATDDPERAVREVELAMREWSPSGYNLQHYWELFALVQCDLYCGDALSANERVVRSWGELRKSLFFRVQVVRIEAIHLRARTFLAAAAVAPKPEPMLRAVERDARRLEREPIDWSVSLATLLRAGVASIRAEPASAVPLLHAAERALGAAGLRLFANAARRARGQASAGGAGAGLCDSADTWMQRHGIARPDRFGTLLCPGRFAPPQPQGAMQLSAGQPGRGQLTAERAPHYHVEGSRGDEH